MIFSPWGIVYSKSPPPGTGTSDIPANILIMLDKSGSMDWNISGRTTLEDPTDVEVDSNGNIYILEYGRNRITKWNSSGTYIKDIGQTQSCNKWGGSWFFKISDDKIYIADWDRQELLKLDLNGNCIKRVRTPYSGPNGIEVPMVMYLSLIFMLIELQFTILQISVSSQVSMQAILTYIIPRVSM